MQQHFGGQLGDAVGRGRFGEDTAFEHRAKFDERQTVIFLDEQPQAVRQFEFPDGIFGRRNRRGDGFRRGARRQQRVERAVFRAEILAGDTLKVGGLHLLDRLQITL